MPRTASAIQTELNGWYAARTEMQGGSSVGANGVTLTRQDLEKVNKTIQLLERELAAANATAAGRRGGAVFSPTKLGGMGY